MKAKSFQIDALTSQLRTGCDAIVLYGTDDGELNHALTRLKQAITSFEKDVNFLSLSKDVLKKTPLLATDEANTPSLMAGRRVLFVSDDTPFPVTSLEHFLLNKQTDALLIIQAGNLTKSNALRVEAEKNPRVLAIACYQPSVQDIQKNILQYFLTHKKKISSSVINEICKKIPLNQEIIQNELDKLLLYLGDQDEVTLDALNACLTDGAESSLETLCINLADGRVDAVQNDITLFIRSHEPETTLFWAVRDYFERLLSIVSDTSEPIPQVVKKNLRPAQFNLETPLIRQARVWTPSAILTLLDKLAQLEKRTRTTALPKETVLGQAFLSLALFAQKSIGLR